MRVLFPLLLLTTLAVLSAPASAEDADWRNCAKERDPDLRIAGCTSVLARGDREPPENRAIAYNDRGNAYSDNGDKDRAIADYDAAIRLNPKYAIAHYNRGHEYQKVGDNDRAIADYDAAIRLNPRHAEFYINRGKAYSDKGDNDRAIADYDQAIQLKPKAVTYNNRGSAYFFKGYYDRAIADYNEAIRLNPQLPDIYFRRGEAYSGKVDHDHAIVDYDEAIRRRPNYARTYYERGHAYSARGDKVRAIADYDQAIRIDPELYEAYYERGNTYSAKGDKDRAIADYDEAIRLFKIDPEPLVARGKIYEERRDWAKARADFQAVLELFDDNVAALQGLKRVAEAEAAAAKTEASTQSLRPAATAADATAATSPVLSEFRVALVIGNARYAAQTPLDNPRNDAAAVAKALRDAGFRKVVSIEDLSRKAMVDALQEFQSEADRADWAVIYFSGHGVEIGGENYLVPVDAHLASDRNAPDEAVSLARVMDSVGGAKKLRMVILDACRNNPFNASMRRTLALKSGGKGLSPPKPPAGTLVFYAAKDGEQAQDGKGSNSPFAAALVKNLGERRLELFKMLRYVTVDVQEATRDAQGQPVQHPTFYGDLASREDFYFRPQ